MKSIKIPIEEAKYYLIQLTYKNEKTGEETTGGIRVVNNKFVFEGDAEESAKVFFDYLIEHLNDYIKSLIKNKIIKGGNHEKIRSKKLHL